MHHWPGPRDWRTTAGRALGEEIASPLVLEPDLSCHDMWGGLGAQGRQGTWNRRVRGCAPQAGPRNFRVFEGPYTRPARPPEASSAGPPEAYIFLGGS